MDRIQISCIKIKKKLHHACQCSQYCRRQRIANIIKPTTEAKSLCLKSRIHCMVPSNYKKIINTNEDLGCTRERYITYSIANNHLLVLMRAIIVRLLLDEYMVCKRGHLLSIVQSDETHDSRGKNAPNKGGFILFFFITIRD